MFTNPLPTLSDSFVALCEPEIRGIEGAYVKECLDSGWLSTAGSFVDRFEQSVADFVGVRHSVATNSGTAALHTALLVAGVGAGDEVLVSTLTFIAPANAIRYVGAWPVFVDAEAAYWQIDPDKAADFLEHKCRWLSGGLYNKETGRRVRAIMPVDILGHPADIDPLLDLGRRYGLTVIEDATESLGARYKERNVGQSGDIACLSFNGNKLITTGGGGMILTNNEEWARRAKHLTTQAKDDPFEYIHSQIGYNYRLTNVQAAIGLAQVERLSPYVERKRRIALTYREGLGESSALLPMPEAQWAKSVFWMYTILVNEARTGPGS